MRSKLVVFFFIVLEYTAAVDKDPHSENQDDIDDDRMHPRVVSRTHRWMQSETEANYWYEEAKMALGEQMKKTLNTNVAKNVILFMGDGMSIPTLFASRVYQEQLRGRAGEEGKLYWESFPFTGLSKTWCIDKQVPDSACTSTAYMTGVKSKYGTVGMNGKVVRGDCATQNDTRNHVNSFLKWAQDQGKSVGIVTTTRVTHASPAGAYAHVADRRWESDADVCEKHGNCMDIAMQLMTQDPGRDFRVILGGGRREFLPQSEFGSHGRRSDGRNLVQEWLRDKAQRNSTHFYASNRTALLQATELGDLEFLLGLFSSSHLPYHLEDSRGTPTLQEMTRAALNTLRKNPKGFVLFVEGGRIDHAHHGTHATLALDETLELAKAVETGREMTSTDDTLIIVTADHAHTMSVAGYSDRGAKINGPNDAMGDDKLGYMTLSYANGPGYRKPSQSGSRHDISADDTAALRYQFPSMVPLGVESHGGEDVAIFSSGPWAHLFTGTIQQSNIAHFIAFASCIHPKSACHKQK